MNSRPCPALQGCLASDECSVGTITALAYMAAIEDPNRFRRSRDIGAYLGLAENATKSEDTDVGLGISKQGVTIPPHYLYEAANVLHHFGQEALWHTQLGLEAYENHRRQTRPRGGGREARGSAWAYLERCISRRWQHRIGSTPDQGLTFPPLRQKRARTGKVSARQVGCRAICA